ncbi:MAG: D-aminoacylase [Paracoccaceae bacterium]
MIHDVLILGGTVIDGTGRTRYAADLAIDDDRITAIGDLAHGEGTIVIQAHGRIVAPGFIDAHTHDDGALLSADGMLPKVSQGVTTVIAGNCGISLAPLVLDDVPPPPLTLVGGQENFRFDRLADYMAELERLGTATNAALLVGHTTLRRRVMPTFERAATESEIALMCAEVEQAMADGALGLSTGLDYAAAVKSSTEEVRHLARAAAAAGGMYVTHTRNYFEHLEEAIEEAIEIATDARAKLVISHHQATGPDNFGKSVPTLKRLDAARRDLDLGLDCYPYAASSTILKPERCGIGVRVVITWSDPHPEMAQRDVASIAKEWGCTEREAALRLLPAGAVYFQLDEDDVQRILAYPHTMIGSDGLPHDEHPHPRLWGTFPRVLGHYARDLGLFPLEDAVRRMTGLPAREFGLTDRGVLTVGNCADVTVFDAETILDLATYEVPKQVSAGIDWVLVNGVFTWAGGKPTGARPGRVLRRRPERPDHSAS